MIVFLSSCNISATRNKIDNDSIAGQNVKDYKILPIDESKSDPSLVDFIKRLNIIVSQKDTTALYSIIDTAIIVSYGGGLYGKSAFIESWKLNDPENSELWKAMKRILKLGGTFEKGDDDKKIFIIPYANSNKAYEILDSELDCYSTAVCINSHEPVYQSNDIKSKIIGYLQYDFVVLPDDSKSNGQLVKIKMYNNKIEGFIDKNSLVYCADRKLDLQKDNTGQWKIMSFAPFD